MPENCIHEETKLLNNLEGAIHSARSLALRDLEHILRMAVLEFANYQANQMPKLYSVKEES